MRPSPERRSQLRIALTMACGLLLCSAAQAAGGVFKWVDRHGIVRYDDQSLLAERLTRAGIARNAVAADARATVPEDFVREVAEQCRDFRERGSSYAEARAIFGNDPAGNQYRLSANQVALEIAQLREKSQRYCRPLAAQHLLVEARAELRRREALKTAAPAP